MTAPQPTAPREPEDILLIEDDPIFTQLSTALLEGAGHRCGHAASGREALEWLGSHHPRLVVTDYDLPDMTAAELAGLVELPPFIVTTGAGSERVAVEMMKLGARDYLVKDAGFVESLPRAVARVVRELGVESRLAEAERRSREIQERLRLVLDGSQEGFWDLDVQAWTWFLSDHAWSVLDAAPGALALTREGLLARLHPEDHAAALEAIEAHLEGRTPALEFDARATTEGGWRWLAVKGRVAAWDAGGRPARVVGTIGDATERKLAEAQELRNHKMESLGLMAGGIAHDFNNLFQTLLSNLELMGPRFAGDSRGRAALERCFGILEKASELSRRMLDYSGGALRAEEVFDLGILVRQEAANLAHRMHALHPGLELVCTVQEGLPAVCGDPGLLVQVLQALVHNAVEAMPGEAGCIGISLGHWDPEATPLDAGGWDGAPQDTPALCLAVRDTGRGIDPDQLHRIFDPFFSTKARGRGLGLSASLGIIRSHDGRIHVESAPGLGSTFRVFLPPAQGAPAEARASTPPPARPGRLILLADDEDDLRASLAEILTEILDFRVIEARDGLEAVDRYRAHAAEVALVIMDVTMPRMTGIQAWEEIRKEHPAARGILCSGYSEETGVQLATGHGFLAFLKKPFNLNTLRETIRMALPETVV